MIMEQMRYAHGLRLRITQSAAQRFNAMRHAHMQLRRFFREVGETTAMVERRRQSLTRKARLEFASLAAEFSVDKLFSEMRAMVSKSQTTIMGLFAFSSLE